MVVETDVGVRPAAVVPVQDRAIDLTIHGQRHLAVAFAGRGGLQLGYPLFEVGAAVAAQIGCLSGRDRHAAYENASHGHEGQAAD
jgi:hypothetical protein